MRGWRTTVRLLPGLILGACAGTGTGNPGDPNSGPDGGPPEGPVQVKLFMSDASRATAPELNASSNESFGRDSRGFAFDLYQELAEADQDLFFSPYSISMALAMTYAGAENATETEMKDALHFSLPEPDLHAAFDATSRAIQGRSAELREQSTGDGFELSIVNQAWGQLEYPFLDSYLDVLAAYYGSGIFGVDFADSEPVRQTINDWVTEQTRDRVKDLLAEGSITQDTRLVLTNSIYFKASWLFEFDPGLTAASTFHAPAGDRTVQMMHQSLEASYVEGPDYQALELPYVSDAVRMLLVLPADGAFADVAGRLNDAFFQEVRGALSAYTVNLTLPRFQFESERRLKEPLSALGMPNAFAPGGADFSGMAGGEESLRITDVFHEAFVAVDEQGTEAAAATAVVVQTRSIKPSAEAVFDRPFIFAVFDQPTGQILFLGQLADPG